MSRHYSAHAQDVSGIINDINSLEPEEAEAIYGIEFRDNGKVFDTVHQREFVTLGEWAEFNVTQDDIEYREEIHGGHEEYY